jgi:DNA-binding MarR family transcriptional regulator
MTLQAEIYKKRPFDVPEEEVFLNVLRTHGVLSNATERFFKAFGLSIATYNVLRILAGAGDEGRTCSEIGQHMVTRVPDVTRLVDRLERSGLVKRTRGREDKRVVRVAITTRAGELLTRVATPLRDLHEQNLGHLTPQEVAELNRLLVRARERLLSSGVAAIG